MLSKKEIKIIIKKTLKTICMEKKCFFLFYLSKQTYALQSNVKNYWHAFVLHAFSNQLRCEISYYNANTNV